MLSLGIDNISLSNWQRERIETGAVSFCSETQAELGTNTKILESGTAAGNYGTANEIKIHLEREQLKENQSLQEISLADENAVTANRLFFIDSQKTLDNPKVR
ncbi:hypothetical protein [Marinococcus halophilus]|uniref:hypothetical protein n=1 Tax=Marinococcus halophilus TaxID=1371 RepID=UPI0009A5B21D|nr:hypothetical protein [Marinococcus halophilus]